MVHRLKLLGLTDIHVAQLMGVGQKTLARHFRKELSRARAEMLAKVAVTLYEQAVAGDVAACIFWLKTQAGWHTSSPIRTELCADYKKQNDDSSNSLRNNRPRIR